MVASDQEISIGWDWGMVSADMKIPSSVAWLFGTRDRREPGGSLVRAPGERMVPLQAHVVRPRRLTAPVAHRQHLREHDPSGPPLSPSPHGEARHVAAPLQARALYGDVQWLPRIGAPRPWPVGNGYACFGQNRG